MANEIEIRKMERWDLQAVLDLINTEGWDYHISEMDRILDVDPHNSLVACSGGVVVGGITVSVFGKRCILGHVVIKDGWRNKGLGREMMDQLATRMDSIGVETMEAFALKAALRFYDRHGYRIVEEIDTFDKVLRQQDVSKPRPKNIRRIGTADLESVCRLDEEVTGLVRERLLRMLMHQFPKLTLGLFDGDSLAGFIFGRENPVMCDIGPWVIKEPNTEDVNAMLDSLLSEFKAGVRALGGVPASNIAVKEAFLSREFHLYNTQYRSMRYKGAAEPFRPGIFALAAFEFG